MKIKTIVARPEGEYELTAILSEIEVQMLAEVGMNWLLANGVTIVNPGLHMIVGSDETLGVVQ